MLVALTDSEEDWECTLRHLDIVKALCELLVDLIVTNAQRKGKRSMEAISSLDRADDQ